ncbi:hypothetical protein [Micromonospora rubida]|uniref:hypothetical protein n=1 Tax=Micromonospora rubida TaxID=2697657 RepID=UPI0013779AAC|nr:hypothetical protein [Micromonospora rubida]NBE84515.1 hypothetical protein [Micromonospora rubida]
MLSVAPVCPLWWVARWTARMLTSLAVAVAFSLGAGSLSFDPAPPADAPGGHAPAWSLTGSLPVIGAPDAGPVPAWSLVGSTSAIGASDHCPVLAAGVCAAGPDRAAASTLSAATGTLSVAAGIPAAPAYSGAVPAGPAGRSVVDPAPAYRMPVGPAPTTAGSRAPPRG